ncbi:hypothetical protein [uncultured Chitinophaga sp.]|jgi:hypothetical protein|uniref:hypothetical protein n=1 Tax=uncultured Chitinophaga sp. TaxID=339340 RepID=UPI002627AC5C|nr:hypothetical protein [uncultured Chitinophaga sp.]
MIKPVKFNPQGERLWINIEMMGIYFVTYTYQLWSADATVPPVLTNPLRSGSNEIPHDDFFPVVNDFNPTEPVERYVGRTIDVRFWVKKGEDDEGYTLTLTVLQGNAFSTAAVIGGDIVQGKTDGASIKEAFITLKLVI